MEVKTMARVKLAPDGNEYYCVPNNTKEANEWLQRAGVNHLRFGTSRGKAALKEAATGRVHIEANSIRDICWFLAWNPVQMQRFGIPFYDWYRPAESWNNVKEVIMKAYM